MGKYTKEFKLKVVQYVLEEKHGVKTAKKHFGLHSHGDIIKWVNKEVISNVCRSINSIWY